MCVGANEGGRGEGEGKVNTVFIFSPGPFLFDWPQLFDFLEFMVTQVESFFNNLQCMGIVCCIFIAIP